GINGGSAQAKPVLCRSYAIAIAPVSKSYGIRRHIRSVAQARAAERTGEMMSNSEVNDRIVDPMMAIANCSTRQRIVVVGAKSMELMIELHRRGYLLAAAAGNCGRPAGQYEVALVDWRRRTLHALDATVD